MSNQAFRISADAANTLWLVAWAVFLKHESIVPLGGRKHPVSVSKFPSSNSEQLLNLDASIQKLYADSHCSNQKSAGTTTGRASGNSCIMDSNPQFYTLTTLFSLTFASTLNESSCVTHCDVSLIIDTYRVVNSTEGVWGRARKGPDLTFLRDARKPSRFRFPSRLALRRILLTISIVVDLQLIHVGTIGNHKRLALISRIAVHAMPRRCAQG